MSDAPADLRGSLEDLPLRAVLGLVTDAGRSGVLHVDGPLPAIVVVGPGRMHLATTGPPTTLHRVLVDAGVVSPEQWDHAVAAEDAGGAVAALVDRGVDPDTLRHALRDHTVSSLFELLFPSADPFRFVSGASHPFALADGFDLEECLGEADELVTRWRGIAAVIPSTDTVVARAPRLPAGSGPVTITPEEWELLGTLDGRRDVAEVVAVTGGRALEVSEALHDLVGRGLAEVLER